MGQAACQRNIANVSCKPGFTASWFHSLLRSAKLARNEGHENKVVPKKEQALMETEALAAAAEMDFSMWGLFARATLTVQLVMLALIFASLWSWAIIWTKHKLYRQARSDALAFEDRFWSGKPLEGLFEEVGPAPDSRSARVFAAGMTEWQRSHKTGGGMIPGAQVRIDRSMDVAIQKESEELQSGLTILATVGSTAPFVGLLLPLESPKLYSRLALGSWRQSRPLSFITNSPPTRTG